MPALLWLGIKRARQASAAAVWSLFYTTYLKLHPACRSARRLRVTGRMTWDLDPYAHMQLGEAVRINSGPLFNAVGGHRRVIIALHRGARLSIGRRTGLSGCTIVCKSAISIGDDVLVGGGVLIVDSDLHALAPGDRETPGSGNVRNAPVTIGDRVFIGADALILKGVSVGADAIVGARAVITRDVPNGEIWAGNPARRVGSVATAAVMSGGVSALIES
jgi:serine acetyltransferase